MIVDIFKNVLKDFEDIEKIEISMFKLLKNAADNGVTHIIAAPNNTINKSEEIRTLVDKMNICLSTLSPNSVTILIGSTIQIYDDIVKDLDLHISIADGKKYLLIELMNSIPENIEQLIFDIQIRGYIPILVFPEKNSLFVNNPTIIYELVKSGLLVQVSASSAIGNNGRKIQRFIFDLIKKNLVHFIFSDANYYEKKSVQLLKAFMLLEKRFSVEKVKYFQENANSLAKGSEFHVLIPENNMISY